MGGTVQARLFGLCGTFAVMALLFAGLLLSTWLVFSVGKGREQPNLAVFDVASVQERQSRPPTQRQELPVPGSSAQPGAPMARSHTDEAPGSAGEVPAGAAPASATLAARDSEQSDTALETAYQESVRAHVLQFRFYPEAARPAHMQGRVLVQMELDREGHVTSAWIERSSGYAALDEAALRMIRRADPMPPVPAQLPSGIEISLPLDFVAPALAWMPGRRFWLG